MTENRQYDHEYKVQALKLTKEIGQAKDAEELRIPRNTMYGWVSANRLTENCGSMILFVKYYKE